MNATPLPASPQAAARARVATSAVFFLNGFVFASWALHIPFVREKLALSTGVLGLALLAIAVGSLVAMPLVGGLVARHGSAPVTRLLVLLNPLALLPLLLAPNLPVQIAVFLLYGAVTGGLDVAMNAQGVTVERTLGKPVLSSFHAAWSFGSLGGAGLGSLALGAGLAPGAHGAVVTVVFLAVALLSLAPLLGGDAEAAPAGDRPRRRGLVPGALLLGLLGFLGLLAEGALNDWSALYYRDELGATPAAAGIGFIAFTAAMTVGRVLGDLARARLGGMGVLGGGAALAAVGLTLALLVASPVPTALGFALFGLGIANIVPVLFDAASRAGEPGPAIAQVSTLGYLGFLVGPPLIGFVAQVVGLPAALGLVAAFAALIALLSGRAVRAGA